MINLEAYSRASAAASRRWKSCAAQKQWRTRNPPRSFVMDAASRRANIAWTCPYQGSHSDTSRGDAVPPVVQQQTERLLQRVAWLPAGVGSRARVAPHQARDVVRAAARGIARHPHRHAGMRAQDGDYLG